MPRGIRSGTMTDAETLKRYEEGGGSRKTLQQLALVEGVSESAIRQRIFHERKRRASPPAARVAATDKRRAEHKAARPRPKRVAPVREPGPFEGIFDGLNRAIEDLSRTLATR